MAKPAIFGKCPVCGKPLSIEMAPVGYELTKDGKKKKEKPMMVFENALFQSIRWAGEMLARVVVALCSAGTASEVPGERHLYYTCNNKGGEGSPACPACYSLLNQIYFKKVGLTFVLVGLDPAGLTIGIIKSIYKTRYKMYLMNERIKKRR